MLNNKNNNGPLFVDMKMGSLDVNNVYVSGKEMSL